MIKKILSGFFLFNICLLLSSCKENKNVESYSISRNNFIISVEKFRPSILEDNYSGVATDLNKFVKTNLTRSNSNSERIELQNVLEEIRKKRELTLEKDLKLFDVDPLEFIGDDKYREGKFDKLTEDELYKYDLYKQSNIVFDESKLITKDEAKEDLIFLDRFFRTYYGYFKFARRENFDKAYEVALENINKFESSISSGEYSDILLDAYYFIKDDHFLISYKNTSALEANREWGYYFDDYYFLKDDKGYYLKDYSPKIYLEKVSNDSNIDNYMHYSVDVTGELVYMLSFFSKALYNEKLIITLDGNDFEIKLKVMGGSFSYSETIKEAESFTLEDGYPVLALRTYLDSSWVDKFGGGLANYKGYAKVGKALKDEPVIIQDTRSNMGGNNDNSIEFYKNILGSKTSPIDDNSPKREAYLKKTTDESRVIYDNPVVFAPADEIVKSNNNKLFINIIDKNTGSAGDGNALAVRYIDNGINVGEPTKGMIVNNARFYFSLPNSVIPIQAGGVVFLDSFNNIDKYEDGKGIEPDIWIPSIEAVDKTIAMLKYYNVKPSDDVSKIYEEYGYGENKSCRKNLSDLAKARADILNQEGETYTIKKDIDIIDDKVVFVKKYIDNKTREVLKITSISEDGLDLKEGKYKLDGYNIIIRSTDE